MGLFVVVMGEGNRAQRASDEKALFQWGFSNYARPTVLAKGQPVVQVPVQGAPGVQVALAPATPLTGTVRVGKPIRVRVSAPSQAVAPLGAGTRLGTVEVLQDNAVVGRRPLVTTTEVVSPGLWDGVKSAFQGIGSVFS